MTSKTLLQVKCPSTVFHRQSITYKSGRLESEEYEDSANNCLVKILSRCDSNGRFPRFEVRCFMGRHPYGPGRVTRVTYAGHGEAEDRYFSMTFRKYIDSGNPRTLREDTCYTPILSRRRKR